MIISGAEPDSHCPNCYQNYDIVGQNGECPKCGEPLEEGFIDE